jgi:hypothetical protein
MKSRRTCRSVIYRAGEIGVEAAIEAIGLERVIAVVGLPRVIETVGLPRVIEAVGAEKLLNELLAQVSTEQIQEILRRRQQQG